MEVSEKKIIWTTCLNHFLTHFFELLFPSMTLFIVADFQTHNPGITDGDVIGAGFLLYLLYGILALPWGYLADRFGASLIMGSGIFIAGIGSLIASYAVDIATLYLALALVGVGIASYHPAGMALISKGISERGRALGINGMWGNLGIVAAPLAAAIGCFYLGWQTLFFICGIFGICAGLFSIFFKVSLPRDTEKAIVTENVKNKAKLYFGIICLVIVCAGLMYRANTIALPYLFENNIKSITEKLDSLDLEVLKQEITDKKGSVRTMGSVLFVSAVYFIGIFGQILGGRLADKFELRWTYLAFWIGTLPCLLGMVFFSNWLLIISAGLFIFFSLGMQPVENSLIARLTPTRWRSVGYAIKFTLGFGVSSVVALIGLNVLDPGSIYLKLIYLLLGLLSILGVLIYVSQGESMRQRGK